MATRYPYFGRNYERGRAGRRYTEDEERGYEPRSRYYGGSGREERGFLDRTTDEVRSWLGDEEAERRRRQDERGYRRGEDPLRELRAGDLMTSNVACVRPDDSVERAARVMQGCECGAVPVVGNDGRLIGIITDRDITVRLVARGIDIRRARVDDCMTDEAFACHVNDPIIGCMRTMSRHQIRRVPIVDDRDRVIGIVSQSDLVRHAGEHPGSGERRAMADVLCAVSEPTHVSYR
jgi:CBS domain-containing protein